MLQSLQKRSLSPSKQAPDDLALPDKHFSVASGAFTLHHAAAAAAAAAAVVLLPLLLCRHVCVTVTNSASRLAQ
jgi:hypothetical protein